MAGTTVYGDSSNGFGSCFFSKTINFYSPTQNKDQGTKIPAVTLKLLSCDLIRSHNECRQPTQFPTEGREMLAENSNYILCAFSIFYYESRVQYSETCLERPLS